MIGDYVLQIDYIAKTKGDNWWHLLSHCVTYTVPFALAFGIDWRIAVLLVTHFAVDAIKARWHVIGYVNDQIGHLLCAAALYAF
jgi:hypothetical protein